MRWVPLALALCCCGRSGPYAADAGARPDSGTPDAGADGGVDAGCAPRVFSDACAAVQNAVFASLSKGECGLCAPGYDCSCTWHLTFKDQNSWRWQHSDYGEAGTYACDGYRLTAKAYQQVYEATWDPSCDLLTWDGKAYRRE